MSAQREIHTTKRLELSRVSIKWNDCSSTYKICTPLFFIIFVESVICIKFFWPNEFVETGQRIWQQRSLSYSIYFEVMLMLMDIFFAIIQNVTLKAFRQCIVERSFICVGTKKYSLNK